MAATKKVSETSDAALTKEFSEAVRYIDAIPKFVKKNTMADTKAFYRKLSCPCRNAKVIHVAGTNGKGSVCAYLHSVLMEAGYRVGLFTSPHLVDIRERIRVDDALISEAEFVKVFRQVRSACGAGDAQREQEFGGDDCGAGTSRQMCGVAGGADYHPSYFEYLYCMAMLYFAETQPDFIILETGLGGRLDATNSFPSPCICIITEIGLDHTEYLGETLADIAEEKAGIVKKGIPLVYFAKNKCVSDIFEKTAKKAETRAFSVKEEEICLENYGQKGIDFSYHCGYYKDSTFHLSTTALYQRENAALCVRAAAVLSGRGIAEVSGEALQKGLRNARWEGRMEEILPGVYLDGAHNADGIAAFLESVRVDIAGGGRILLYSSLEEKACGEMIRKITDAGLFEEIVVTRINNGRAAEPAKLAGLFGAEKAAVIEDVREAFRHCIRQKTDGRKLYITGSLYLAGQVKALMGTDRTATTDVRS